MTYRGGTLIINFTLFQQLIVVELEHFLLKAHEAFEENN